MWCMFPEIRSMTKNFFFILNFLRGKSTKKTVQIDKKFCLLPLYMLHICKMIIYSAVFVIFLKFWFFGLLGGKRQKLVQMTKTYVYHHALCLGNQISHNCLFFLLIHSRLNSHYKALSYKKKKHKMIKAHMKSV